MPGSRVRLFASLLERQRQRGLPSDEAIQSIVDAVAHAMDTDVATLYVLDSSAGELVLAATRGLARSGVGFVTLRLGEGISGTAALRRSPVTCSDVSQNTVFKLIPGFDQSRYESILAVPIVLDDEVIGALNVQTTAVHQYGESEIQDLVGIARTIAQTVKHYWSEGDLALRLRGPKLLSSVDGILAASFGPTQICEQVATALNAILPNAQSIVAFKASDSLQTVPNTSPAPVLLSAMTACVECGQAVELESGEMSILALPLRGQNTVCGVLAIAAGNSAPTPWDLAHVRHYLEALTDRVGLALEPLILHLRRESQPAHEATTAGSSLYADLVERVLQDRGLEEVVEAAGRACNAEIAVVDVFGTTMAGNVPADVDVDLQLTAGGHSLGRLLSSASPRHLPGLETAAQVISLELAKSKVRFEVEGQLRGGVLELLLSGADIDGRELQARASLVGLDLRRDYTPVMFAFDTSSRLELTSPMATRSLIRAVQRHLGAPPDSVAFHRPDGLLVLVNNCGPRLQAKVGEVLEELRFLAHLDVVGTGVGTAASRPADYAGAVKKAMLAATLGVRLGMNKPVTSSELGVQGLLLAVEDSDQLREYVQSQIGPLLSSDEKSGGDLTRTLGAYHTSGERLSVAAKLLSVHVNTLKYRLARIESLTGRSLRDPIARFNMYLALYALRLAEPRHPTVIPDELSSIRLATLANARTAS